MSHTKRIYNKKIKKAQRYNIEDINHNMVGFPYVRYGYICMGRCKMCRDSEKDQRVERKRRKEQFNLELRKEEINVSR
jgi:hypothetical protein